MTWTANAEVTEIKEHDDGWSIIVEAHADRTYKTGDFTVQELYSNTEGKIKSVAIEFVVDREPALKIGDRVTASGHFSAAPSP